MQNFFIRLTQLFFLNTVEMVLNTVEMVLNTVKGLAR